MGSLQQQSILKGAKIAWADHQDALVHELFRKVSSENSERTAIVFEAEDGTVESMTYAELDSRSNRIARILRKICEPRENEDAVAAISMKPSLSLPVTLLSVLKAGMAYLPLDAEFPSSRVKHILEEAEPLILIIDANCDRSSYMGDTPLITFEDLWAEAESEKDDSIALNGHPEQIAIVLYTSGSTGIPKGVRLPHASLMNRLQWQWRELPYEVNEDRCIFKTALTFVDSAPEIWGPLLQGRTIVVVPRQVTKDPAKFVQVLEKHLIRRLVLVPSLLRSMLMYLSLREKADSLTSLKLWICSGESLPRSLAEQFFARFASGRHVLANFYGSTEVMGDVTYYLVKEMAQLENFEKVPIGRPLDNCLVYLVNKDMRPVALGEVGELVVAGRNLAAGYIRGRDPHKFVNNPHAIDPEFSTVYLTGDYARIVKGTVVYEGRTDAQIKIRGHRVDLAEVERSVAAAPGVDKAVVLCYKPGELSQAMIAFVTAKETSVSGPEVEDHLQSRMPPYMIPHVIAIDSIPLLVNGKTDRQSLLHHYESSYLAEKEVTIDCDYTGVPENQLEKAKILFPTVATVIGKSGRSTVHVNANFYELGGNSLNSIYTVTKLQDQGYRISVTDFIAANSMASVLENMTAYNSDTSESEDADDEEEYVVEQLGHSHKQQVIEIITDSFYKKADLERWLLPDLHRSDYTELMEKLWDALVEKGFCFVVKSSQGNDRVLAVSLNFDARDEPEVTVDSKLTVIFEFLEHLEGPIRDDKLPQGRGKIFHTFMMGTSSQLNPAENVIMMKIMEDEALRVAKRKQFAGIFTTNTSPLTQQLGSDIYHYEVLLDFQVNKYVAPDGTKPFGKAPDDQRALCSWKTIS